MEQPTPEVRAERVLESFAWPMSDNEDDNLKLLANAIREAEIAALKWAEEWALRGNIWKIPCPLEHGPLGACIHDDLEAQVRVQIAGGIKMKIGDDSAA